MTEKELKENGYRLYRGEEVDVYFKLSKCIHAGNCVRTLPEVFNVKRTPWIIANNASKEAIKETVLRCPSGALQYIEKDNK
ncbi:(4Fe-4S)-binding protein [Candidatus Clostridium radicumherbarum]|uniref:(4Fe-4S)-binding protein n=1 Tax=Candidatus Clostridium radicumherbarum TaxID=3381662 RepID=A0ABW8TQI7_9CLOT